MKELIGIFAGVLLSGATSLSLGTILFRRLAIKLERVEHVALAFVVGSACFSQIIFFLCSTGLARKNVFFVIGLLAGIGVLDPTRKATTPPAFARSPLRWARLLGVLFVPFSIVYLVNAIAPEMSPDGSSYHLPFVARYLDAHGFERVIGNFYASLSQGIELLFMPAYSLGQHSAAAMVHFLFLLDLPLLMICYGRRFGFPAPAAAAAFLVFASPVLGWDGTSAYVDVAASATLFALFYLLQVWDADRMSCLLVPIGILAGFSYAAKYSAGIAVPYALGFVALRLYSARASVARPLLTISTAAAFFILPWMIKNAIFADNPLAPFANQIFPNRYVHVSFEQQYLQSLRHYQLTNWFQAPWELTVKGERLQGFFGPVFLLMPLAVLSLRTRNGRRLLLAGSLFALPWFLNIGTRFLIPAAPPLALAFALALERRAVLLPAITVLHGFLSWYSMPVHYPDDYAPRIRTFPWAAALRIEPEEVYLGRNSSGYLIDRMIEREVPRGEKVFSFGPVPGAWTTREILAGYTAADNEAIVDTFWTALNPALCPERALDFRFVPRRLRGLRATQTEQAVGEMWSISEFQIFGEHTQLAPNGKWRLNAHPNPWDASFAFDNNPVTRWRSWSDARAGMFIEVNFGEPVLIDKVRLLTTPDAVQTHVELEGLDADGEWQRLPVHLSTSSPCLRDSFRAAAIRTLLSRGIRYLLILPEAFGANELNENAGAWGMRVVGESGGARLYHLEAGQASPSHEPLTIAQRPAVPPGRYDDPDSRFHLQAAWTRDTQFRDAFQHTLTYSNVTGASISLAFNGSAVTYVYTRAHNRGIAEVYIDGLRRDHLDLYSPNTEWKSQTRYNGLGLGRHVIQIRVAGQRNTRASDCFVDLDAMIID